MNEGAVDRSFGGTLSSDSRSRLNRLMVQLEKWNPAINLVAAGSLADAWQRHIADSAQVFTHLPARARTWLDLGTGGGFPGLVVAILAKEKAPDLRVELVESDQRKCVFLQTVARSLDLPVIITCSRIEALLPRGANVISARALAHMEQLCRYCLPHLAPEGLCLFLKGSSVGAELAEAKKSFNFNFKLFPSETDSTGILVQISDLTHV